MTETVDMQSSSLSETSPPGVPLESILRTEELRSRPSRAPEFEKDNAALVELCSALVDSPRTILQTLDDKDVQVLRADSAGLSLLTTDEQNFYWAAIAGARKPHIGGERHMISAHAAMCSTARPQCCSRIGKFDTRI